MFCMYQVLPITIRADLIIKYNDNAIIDNNAHKFTKKLNTANARSCEAFQSDFKTSDTNTNLNIPLGAINIKEIRVAKIKIRAMTKNIVRIK